MSSCDVGGLINYIRENSADCDVDRPHKRTDDYINKSICYAIDELVADKSDEFVEVVEVKLKNGECAQSSCDQCSGVVKAVGNVNGGCTDPTQVNEEDTQLNAYYSRHYNNIACVKDQDDEDYQITHFEVLSKGGCEFKVEPSVPKTGVFKLKILCLVIPDISSGKIPERLCRYSYLIQLRALFWIYMFEADPAMKIKAMTFADEYAKAIGRDRDVNRDLFVESIQFGSRVGTDEQ